MAVGWGTDAPAGALKMREWKIAITRGHPSEEIP